MRLSKEREAEIRRKMGKDVYTRDALAELDAARAERDEARRERNVLRVSIVETLKGALMVYGYEDPPKYLEPLIEIRKEWA